MSTTVVKVGGSLFDWPDLGPRLQTWLHTVQADKIILVPGGGPIADAIRLYDRIHHLGEESSHWLALRALTVNAHFLGHLLPGIPVVRALEKTTRGACILDMEPFARAHDELPHTWNVTSDSLALCVARVAGAAELVLLKSVDFPADVNWEEAARRGLVDEHFCRLLSEMPDDFRVRVCNIRKSNIQQAGPP